MYKATVVKYFGGTVKLAAFLKINSSAVSQWTEIIPEKQALRLERITDGALKYDSALYKKAA